MSLNILCNSCERDLTTSNYGESWRIVLGREKIPSDGGAVMDVYIYPPIKGGPYHFCDLQCLDLWRTKEMSQP